MRLRILADQLNANVGGGTYSTQFVRELLTNDLAKDRIESIQILLTQNEELDDLPIDSNVQVVRRRFPSRLRHSIAAKAVAKLCPPADVSHGLFFYDFPDRATKSCVTVHDVSFLYPGLHEPNVSRRKTHFAKKVLNRVDQIICSSDTTLENLLNHWPKYRDKCQTIYLGTGPPQPAPPQIQFATSDLASDQTLAPMMSGTFPYILVVGTIEPRKNYGCVLSAFTDLMQNNNDVHLVIVGAYGWGCEAEKKAIDRLAAMGRVHWIKDATDHQLVGLYKQASLVSYLSIHEGFGYPPFEAAHLGIPLVLGDESSVGEIWKGFAKCVSPRDRQEIMAAWQWGLSLNREESDQVTQAQKKRAAEFTYTRCIEKHLEAYGNVIDGKP